MKLKTIFESIAISPTASKVLKELRPILEGRSVNNIFEGEVNLSNEFVHYAPYTVTSNIEITIKQEVLLGGYAELTLIGDGTHIPTWSSNFTATPNSSEFNPTLNTVNKVGIYYDGTLLYYTITVIS